MFQNAEKRKIFCTRVMGILLYSQGCGHSCHHRIAPWGKPRPCHPGSRRTWLTAKPARCQLVPEEEDSRALLRSVCSLCSRTSWRSGRWRRRPSGRSISSDPMNNDDDPPGLTRAADHHHHHLPACVELFFIRVLDSDK